MPGKIECYYSETEICDVKIEIVTFDVNDHPSRSKVKKSGEQAEIEYSNSDVP